ncbi:MAG: hypothetical protein NVV82_29145 [Sporocytophaga sp.]|nr:hypothetical protein [Sporocytophaga sp.]
MKRLIIFLGLTIFTLMSCNEENEEVEEIQTTIAEQPTEEPIITNNKLNVNDHIVTQGFDLYLLRDLESIIGLKVGFISLSEIYPLSEHPDSLAIPNPEEVNKDSLQYFKLSSEYRNRFLSKTKISEEDSVFIYDYSTDVLVSYPVKILSIVAYLNVYMEPNECPCRQNDYMIGFQINKSSLTGFDKYLNNSLVYVGKENPFILGQMRPISWERIDIKDFPLEKSNIPNNVFRQHDVEKGNAYLYNSELYQYYIQEYSEGGNSFYLVQRHLIVTNMKDDVILEKVFNDSEGTSIAPLNFGIENSNFSDLKEQWTGYLFKNKPQVVFGFVWSSFGCPNIIFLDSNVDDVYINCDNRH